MAGKIITGFLGVICLNINVKLVVCSVSQPDDVTTCNTEDINIPWIYTDSASMNAVLWEFIDTSNTLHTIMIQGQGAAALPQPGYDVIHISNGGINITNVDTAVSGTYRITVSYSSSTPTAVDEVNVTVLESATGLGSTSTILGCNATYTCTATSLGGPVPATLHVVVDGQRQSTAVASVIKDCANVQCTLDGAAATACLDSTYLTVLTKSEKQCTYCEVCVGICSAGPPAVIVGLVFLGIAVFACHGKPGSGIHRVVAGSFQLTHVVGVLSAIVTSLYCLAVGIAGVAALHTGCDDCECECGCDCCIYDQEDCNICKRISIACIIVALIGLIVTVAAAIYKSQGPKMFPRCLGGNEIGRGPPDGSSNHHMVEKHRDLDHNESRRRPLPPNPNIAASHERQDTGSAGTVSGTDVQLEKRPIPDIRSDRQNRGLSANLEDPHKMPHADIDLPRGGKSRQLEPLSLDQDDTERNKKKKKKKKDRDTARSEDNED